MTLWRERGRGEREERRGGGEGGGNERRRGGRERKKGRGGEGEREGKRDLTLKECSKLSGGQSEHGFHTVRDRVVRVAGCLAAQSTEHKVGTVLLCLGL